MSEYGKQGLLWQSYTGIRYKAHIIQNYHMLGSQNAFTPVNIQHNFELNHTSFVG